MAKKKNKAGKALLAADRKTQRRLTIGVTCLAVGAVMLIIGFFALGGTAGVIEAIGSARAQIAGSGAG